MRVPQQCLSRDRQRNAARMAFEQYRTHSRFEIRDAFAGGADSQQGQFGALAEAATAGYLTEKREREEIEPVEVHGAGHLELVWYGETAVHSAPPSDSALKTASARFEPKRRIATCRLESA